MLKEAANLNKANDKIEKLMVGSQIITDQGQMAECFNDFFVNIGTKISESVPITSKKPEDLMPCGGRDVILNGSYVVS